MRWLVTVALCGAALALACAPTALAAPPTVTIAKPLGGALTNDPTPIFSGTADEQAAPVTLSVYAGTVAEGTPVQTSSTSLIPLGLWSIGPLKKLDDGVYTARASETNGALETGISSPVTFRVDTGPPAVTLDELHPAPGEAAPAFAGTATDTTPVVVQIHAGASEEGPVVSVAAAAGTGGGWRSSAASPALKVGRYTAVAIQSSSLSGNPAGQSTAVGFDVLPAPPPTPAAVPPASGVASLAQAAQPKISLMAPFPVVRVTGVALGSGTKLRLLSVQQAPAGALVRVRCHGHGCPPHGARRTTIAGPHGVPAIVFRSFQRYLRAGAVVEVLITKPGTIGKYTRLRMRRGRLPERIDECLDPTGARPIACPSA